MDRAKEIVPATLNADRDEVMFGPSTTQKGYERQTSTWLPMHWDSPTPRGLPRDAWCASRWATARRLRSGVNLTRCWQWRRAECHGPRLRGGSSVRP